jgi:hypothetical protein
MEKISNPGEAPEANTPKGEGPQDVVFLGWQKRSSGDAIPLYNVMAENHPLYGSTVTDTTLQKHNLPVPPPSPLDK